MEKIKTWINKNKGLTIVIILTLVLFTILLVIFLEMLLGGSSDKYGNRLDGIDDVKIANDVYDGVEQEVMDTGLAEKVEVRLQGKIVYTTITLKGDTTVEKAKEIASNTLDNYTEEELSFYDFSYFLQWKGEEADKIITGNKHHNLEKIAWVKS